MSKGPEANFWQSLRKNLPNNSFATRIENNHGGGVPDAHIVWDGLTFWCELKTTKINAVNVSPHQIAWHMAYFARGGLSFFLVKSLSTKKIYSFLGDQGVALSRGGISAARGACHDNPAALFQSLRPRLLDHYSATLRLCDPAA